MDIIQLYRDYNVPFVTEGHKHARPGWVNTPCPLCTGHEGFHLGYDIQGDKFVCWRCGGHWAPKTLSALLNVSLSEASQILKEYGLLVGNVAKLKPKPQLKPFKLPDNTKELKNNHRNYLIGRGFDPDKLIKDYKIKGTGPSALLMTGSGDDTKFIDYKHRIIIPYFWNGEMVSFDSRDITNKTDVKYLACPEDSEEKPRKNILYGRPDKWGDFGIIVEGCTDVWRLGFNAAAVSGIQYTPTQLRLIAKTFKRVAVIFDDECQAIIQASKLVADLKFRGCYAFRVDIEGDPGAMSQDDADHLIRQLKII